MDENKIRELALSYLRGEASEEDAKQLHKWYEDAIDDDEEIIQIGSEDSQDHIRQRILSLIQEKAMLTGEIQKPSIPFSFKRKWMQVAAAFLLISLGTFAYFYIQKSGSGNSLSLVSNIKPENDVLPGKNKASLTLANGEIIVLDSAASGVLAKQGSSVIINQNGQLVYSGSQLPSNKLIFNTLTTSRGELYPLTLSDGTKVWLNAESSIRFPVAFTDKQRRVEVIGEAYFEVAVNKEKPFIVSIDQATIEVIGTHFNVMAYKNESVLKTTLLEGSIKFNSHGETLLLRPGEQSQLSGIGELQLFNNIDTDKVIAWKNGYFDFEGTDFGTIAKQLSRWYDVEVNYDQRIKEQFYARISRDTKLSVVLKALELTGKVSFEMNGKTVIVKSNE